jgi:hypothetical protein
VSRYLPTAEPDLLPPAEHLRVLLLVESPPGFPVIDTEVEQLQAAIAGLGPKVDLRVERNLTAQQLQNTLQECHVLHLLAHGFPGEVLLTGADGGGAAIEDQAFAQLFLGRPSLRLVVLCACSSSQATGEGLFAGTGPALIRKRVPAVVAMQYRAVRVTTAGQFSQAFYAALTRGREVGVAVNEGRQSLSAGELLAGRDWSTPVLYLGTRSSLLFDFWRGPGQPAQPLQTLAQGQEEAQKALEELASAFETIRAALRRVRLLTELRDVFEQLRAGFARCRAGIDKANGIPTRIDGDAVENDWGQLCDAAWQELCRLVDELGDVPGVTAWAAPLRAGVQGLLEVFQSRAMVPFTTRVLDFDKLLNRTAPPLRRQVDEAVAVAVAAVEQASVHTVRNR